MTPHLRVEVLQDRRQVVAARAALEDLCHELCEPNIFYEPWFLFPALEHLASDERFQFLCLYEQGGRQRLCGFVPLIESRLHPLLPLMTYEVWAHSQCFRCTPLVRRGFAGPFWHAVLSWLEGQPWHCRLLHLHRLPAEGELWDSLRSALEERPSLRALLYRFDSAFLRTGRSYDETLSRSMSKSTRRKLVQQRRRLSERGQLTFTDLDGSAAVDSAIEEFLRIEASGWKGRAGTALASNRKVAAFYRDVMRAACDQGRLTFLSLRLDGRAIATQCTILAPPGAFHFKCAYDESYRQFSPGILLEMESVHRMHDPDDPLRSGLTWCDSCAGPEDGPDYRCWPQRRPIARYRITTGWTPHAVALALWPLGRRLLGRGSQDAGRPRGRSTSGRRHSVIARPS